jgi:hypothetical protein
LLGSRGGRPHDTEGYRSTVREFPGDGSDDEEDDDGPIVRIIEERPPLREGKVSSTSTSAPPSPSRWRPPTSLWTYELESLTLEASAAVERAWRTLSAVMEAHTAQAEAGLESEDE